MDCLWTGRLRRALNVGWQIQSLPVERWNVLNCYLTSTPRNLRDHTRNFKKHLFGKKLRQQQQQQHIKQTRYQIELKKKEMHFWTNTTSVISQAALRQRTRRLDQNLVVQKAVVWKTDNQMGPTFKSLYCQYKIVPSDLITTPNIRRPPPRLATFWVKFKTPTFTTKGILNILLCVCWSSSFAGYLFKYIKINWIKITSNSWTWTKHPKF